MSASAEKLQKARDLIAGPGGWCQGALARDRNGKYVTSSSDAAVSWCAVGALQRATGRSIGPNTDLVQRVAGQPLIVWNDAPERTQAAVVALFGRAIELARAS